jgi:hypothetical protein
MQRLCSRGILLEGGHIALDQDMPTVAGHYLSHGADSVYTASALPTQATITRAATRWSPDTGIELVVQFESPEPLKPPILGLVLEDRWGNRVFGTNSRFDPHPGQPAAMQQGEIHVHIRTDQIRPDTYFISLWLGDSYGDRTSVERAVTVDVAGGEDGAAVSTYFIGNVKLPTSWTYREDSRVSAARLAGD